MFATKHNPTIWRELEPMADGFVPAIRRTWLFVGIAGNGKPANMPVELVDVHPTIPDMFRARVVFAHNALFAPEWVRRSDLVDTAQIQ